MKRLTIHHTPTLLTAVLAPLIFHQSQAGAADAQARIQPLPSLGGSRFQIQALSRDGTTTGFLSLTGNTQSRAFVFSDQGFNVLPTFGGAYSQGLAINSLGQVAGSSATASGIEHAFFFDGTEMLDLGTLGGSYSSAFGVNDAGQVVGDSYLAGDAGMEVFLYQAGNLFSLGSLGGGFSLSAAINNSGMVAGSSFTAGYENHAFLWSNGAMRDLGTLGGTYSSGLDLNDAGMVVGEAALADGWPRAFVFVENQMIDLGTLGGPSSRARRINAAGDIVGTSDTVGGDTHGFIYSASVMTDLGTLGGSFTYPEDLNNLGQVVGESDSALGVLRPFLWENGAMRDLNEYLPTGSGWELQTATLINDSGRIAGSGLLNGVLTGYVLDLAAPNTPPVAVVGPDQSVQCGSEVVLDGTGSWDADGDSLTYEWTVDGAVADTTPVLKLSLPLGTHVATLKVTDPNGGSDLATLTITVQDTQAPIIAAIAASPSELAPPNRRSVAVVVRVEASDGCDTQVASRIVAITANEPINPGDAVITGDLTATLVADRSPAGTGRLYTLKIECTDASGNVATGTVMVSVPKGKKDK